MEKAKSKQVSLVQYDTPILVTTKEDFESTSHPDSERIKKKTESDRFLKHSAEDEAETSKFEKTLKKLPLKSKIILPPLEELRKKETEEILNYILPPKKWEEEGNLWVQAVSTTPATPVDVQQLQEHLDLRLEDNHAFETGICPIRRELYTQCFDELIRQVTVNCVERGVLLYRIRDELSETLEAYQRLYTSACAYGVRKALHAEVSKVEAQTGIEELQQEVENLEIKAEKLRQENEQIKLEAESASEVEAEKHEEAKQVLHSRIQVLKKKLEGIIKETTHCKK